MDDKSVSITTWQKYIPFCGNKRRITLLNTMYKKGDVVLVRSLGGDAIPHIHVRLCKKIIEPPRTYGEFNDKGYIAWESTLIYKSEAVILSKEWSIPYRYPDKMELFVFEEDIIKKVKK